MSLPCRCHFQVPVSFAAMQPYEGIRFCRRHVRDRSRVVLCALLQGTARALRLLLGWGGGSSRSSCIHSQIWKKEKYTAVDSEYLKHSRISQLSSCRFFLYRFWSASKCVSRSPSPGQGRWRGGPPRTARRGRTPGRCIACCQAELPHTLPAVPWRRCWRGALSTCPGLRLSRP